METKKNLNNVQRKMLDEIYTEQFKKKADIILEERRAGYVKLQAALLAKESKNKEVKAMLDAGTKFYELENKLHDQLISNGVTVDYRLSNAPKLSVTSSYRSEGRYAELEAYQSETYRIEIALGEKKKLMRAKIYGVASSYEEIEKDISEILKDV